MSEVNTMIVLSSSPISSRAATIRPVDASTVSTIAANTSMWREKSSFSSGGSSSQESCSSTL